jgi:putative DNA primase/helicase
MTTMDAHEVTKALGGRWCGRYGLVRCPAHDDREPSLSIRDGEHELIVNCFAGCAWQDVKAELKRQGLIDDWSAGVDRRGQRARQQAPAAAATAAGGADDLEQRVAVAMGIWSASIQLPDTLGCRYFIERRGLHIGALNEFDHCLRWHGGINAVIGLMADPVTNEPTGVHRTFLNPDGTKRERKMLGRQGIIRLSRDEDVLEGLGICEGLETGLRILLNTWAPLWCAGDAGGIKRFPVLGGIESLTIFTEDDENNTNINAAHVCADRWVTAGREVRLADPKDSLNGLRF